MLRMSWLSSVRLLRTGDQVTEHLLNETFCVHFMCTKSLFFVSESSSFAELAATPKQEGFISWTMFIV